jgi:hypothetical protein
MRKVGPALLLAAAACGSGDNVVIGSLTESSITPFIAFDNIQSVISGRAQLFDQQGKPTGTFAEVVIISNQPGLCSRLQVHPDYFRNPPEYYLALILFLPATDHLGTFEPGRPGDEGTGSEIIGVKQLGQVAPFQAANVGYIALSDWSAQPGGEAVGSFNLFYAAPPPLSGGGGFYGKFKSTVCPTLDGTLLCGGGSTCAGVP